MSLITALSTKLLATSAITTIVSTRVRPGYLDEGDTVPAVTIVTNSKESFEHLQGAAGLAQITVTFHCYQATGVLAEALAEQVRLLLQGFAGTLSSVVIRAISYRNENEMLEQPLDGKGRPRWRRSITFLISYQEAIPA